MTIQLIGVLTLLLVAACSNDKSSDSEAGGNQRTDPNESETGSNVNDSDSLGGDSNTTQPLPSDTPLAERLDVVSIDVGEGVMAGVRNWRVWSYTSLDVAPVYTVPLADGGTIIGFTTDDDGTITPRALVLDAKDTEVNMVALEAGLICRGVAAEPDGSFAALLWDDDPNDNVDRIFVYKYNADGSEDWHTELTNSDNSPTDFGIGESRLEYGNGTYGAYYHVHSDSGHEGDTLKWIDASTGAESTGWEWGCSHSMSNLLRYNDALDDFLPVCVTDCYPGTSGNFATQSIGGIYLNHRDGKVIDVDAGCNGRVAGELGGAAPVGDGWALVFNAHQAETTLGQDSYNQNTMNQDIGFSFVDASLNASAVKWLTNTPEIDEADASIALWNPADASVQQFIVGWSDAGASHQLARLDDTGTIVEGPIDVSTVAAWGKRDDPFRTAANGDIIWAWFDTAGSVTLHVARLNAGN